MLFLSSPLKYTIGFSKQSFLDASFHHHHIELVQINNTNSALFFNNMFIYIFLITNRHLHLLCRSYCCITHGDAAAAASLAHSVIGKTIELKYYTFIFIIHSALCTLWQWWQKIQTECDEFEWNKKKYSNIERREKKKSVNLLLKRFVTVKIHSEHYASSLFQHTKCLL